ncbi:hypothetical protein scyTo_0017242, partial [Scyliorhinus torazame]|nr:hypothetical protein [Scyliorhinus torazame]
FCTLSCGFPVGEEAMEKDSLTDRFEECQESRATKIENAVKEDEDNLHVTTSVSLV